MSGVYANWIKPQYPFMNNDIPQMRSEGFQPRFYFGGSNVPQDIGVSNSTIGGTGLDAKFKFPVPKNQGISRQTTGFSNKSRVIKPRNIKHIV